MKLSILDQAPILEKSSPRKALEGSLKLAKLGEKLGYTRYWIAEHHDINGLACSAPEVMLAYIGAQTNSIRIGSGAVLLPHYKPLRVAESFNMLATLFPDRVDLGIGRAPGGSAEVTTALNDNFLQQVYQMPNLVKELLHFLRNDFPSEHKYAKVTATPQPLISPTPWLLGTSKKSAILAAENGLPYAFGEFMSEEDGSKIIDSYTKSFQSCESHNKPYSLVTVSAVCAKTTAQAERIVEQSYQMRQDTLQHKRDESDWNKYKRKIIYGNPSEVKKKLQSIQALYQVDEVMLVTIPTTYEERIQSYQMIADEILVK